MGHADEVRNDFWNQLREYAKFILGGMSTTFEMQKLKADQERRSRKARGQMLSILPLFIVGTAPGRASGPKSNVADIASGKARALSSPRQPTPQ
jgi:hypothetical protein